LHERTPQQGGTGSVNWLLQKLHVSPSWTTVDLLLHNSGAKEGFFAAFPEFPVQGMSFSNMGLSFA